MSAEETLSALLDDEAQELELRRLLLAVEERPELRERWRRQQLARAALRGEPLRAPAELDLAARVRAALDAEPPPARPAGAWRRALGGLAVAASVAAVTLVGGSLWVDGEGPAGAARVGALPVGVVNSVGAVPLRASLGNRALPARPGGVDYRELAAQRLQRYSQAHAGHAALNTPVGMVPYARVPVIEP